MIPEDPDGVHAQLVPDAPGTEVVPLLPTSRVRVRMYLGARESLRSWRKNTSAGLGGAVAVAAILAGAGVVSSVAPAVAIVRGPRLPGAVGLVLQLAARAASDEVCPTPRRA